MKLRWTHPALNDVAEIHAHIAAADRRAAAMVSSAIRHQTEMLCAHSMAGRAGRVDGTRELVITGYPYIVAYRIIENFIDVLAIRHTARRWPDRID